MARGLLGTPAPHGKGTSLGTPLETRLGTLWENIWGQSCWGVLGSLLGRFGVTAKRVLESLTREVWGH